MDKDTLRLGLAIAGILLVLAILIWDRICKFRLKKTSGSINSPGEKIASEHVPDSLNTAEDESLVDGVELPSMRADSYPGDDENIAEISSFNPATDQNAESKQMESNTDSDLIQLFVAAREEMVFPGHAVFSSLQSAGMELGEMEIFHFCTGDQSVPLFSAVNMLEPGTFPSESEDSFTTPGIVLFLQISQLKNPLGAFDEMVHASHAVASRLGGVVLDETREVLSVNKTESLRKMLSVAIS